MQGNTTTTLIIDTEQGVCETATELGLILPQRPDTRNGESLAALQMTAYQLGDSDPWRCVGCRAEGETRANAIAHSMTCRNGELYTVEYWDIVHGQPVTVQKFAPGIAQGAHLGKVPENRIRQLDEFEPDEY